MNSVWLMIQVLTGGHCPPSGTPCWACRKPSAPHWAGIMIYLAGSDLWKLKLQLQYHPRSLVLFYMYVPHDDSHHTQCDSVPSFLHFYIQTAPSASLKSAFSLYFIPLWCCFIYFRNNYRVEVLILTLLKSSLVPQNSSLSLEEFFFSPCTVFLQQSVIFTYACSPLSLWQHPFAYSTKEEIKYSKSLFGLLINAHQI